LDGLDFAREKSLEKVVNSEGKEAGDDLGVVCVFEWKTKASVPPTPIAHAANNAQVLILILFRTMISSR
jgi:hypothetical protein